MRRYFVQGSLEKVIFSEDDVFHIVKVMRMHEGEEVEIVLNGHIYLASLTSLKPLEVKVKAEIKEDRELNNDITLLYCLPKGDKLNLVIQKATELGVKNIVGVISSRTIIRLDSKEKERKLERFNKIIKEACEQSKRAVMPAFLDIIDYQDIGKYVSTHNFIAYEGESLKENHLYEDLLKIKEHESISILVGAEGGFSLEEVKFANDHNFKNVSLGTRILRSETAAIYFLSVLAFMLGR